MNDRERLIELIGRFLGGCELSDVTPPYGYENLADHLISNGVTVQKHGRWEYHDCVCTGEGLAAVYSCSECNACIDEEAFEQLHTTNFRPNCGAKMDGET